MKQTHKHPPPAGRRRMLGALRRGLRGPAENHRTGDRWWPDGGALMVIAVVMLLIGTAVAVRMRRSSGTASGVRPATMARASMPDTLWDESWPHLVITGVPARSLEAIRIAYAFAARRPEVVQSLPCFCGCIHQGHESNASCYVTSRSPAGRPRWTTHAITCGMCVDITHEAIVMSADHTPVDAIRRAVAAKYQNVQ